MTLTPEQIETLKSFHGLDADEAQLVFEHIDGLEEAIESLRQGALEWKGHAKRFQAELENIANATFPEENPGDFRAWAQNRARHTLHQ